MIRLISHNDDFDSLAILLNSAFGTVAGDLGITRENAPTNNAFIDGNTLKNQLINKREFYVYLKNNQHAGFIGIEHSSNDPETFYIEKLGVHPDYRHQGIGKALMLFAEQRIQELNGKRVSIGLVNSNTILKNWYISLGYVEKEVKEFNHLPFLVCIMEKLLIF